ncbi:ribosome small subunit-dependent GTPase A [Castellaniella sp.]|uniref:ribosome small subunit-dependent GTPase A n=1 Tax=Castellaniella sp. TaxID=1955812 RepID=UPI00355DC37B
MPEPALLQGRIIAAHGRHYRVEMDGDGTIRHCYVRGKKSGLAVGDRVLVRPEGEEGLIVEVMPRRNLFYRSDANRSKLFAANIDQLLLVIAPEPEFSLELISRALVAADSAGVPVCIVLNKADLPGMEQARARLQGFADLGVPIIEVSALSPVAVQHSLGPRLKDRCSLLLGQSGMGKSTLLNALVPNAQAHTGALSAALGTGRHTTTHTRLHALPQGGTLIDSPGFQAFGLQHLSADEVERGFPELAAVAANCRFANCRHHREPGCAVQAGIAQGDISPERHALYLRILEENAAGERY